MQEGEAAILDQRQAGLEHRLVLGREAGDQVGAERDSGAQRLGAGAGGNRVGPAVPALHTFQDQVVAGL